MAIFNDESRKLALDEIGARFTEYYADREGYDEVDEINDSMYKGATSRGKWDAQERTWTPLIVDNKSNVGSVLFHRQVNTRAGMLGAIIASGRQLFKYVDRYVEGVPMAAETGAFEAGVMNSFAKWALDEDDWRRKAPEFCTDVYKRSNVFIMVGMDEREVSVLQAEDVEDGETVDEITGKPVPTYKKVLKQKKLKTSRPTFSFPDPRNIYLNKNIANIQDQETVIILSLTSQAQLSADPQLDQDAVQAITKKEQWDGTYGSESIEAQRTNLPDRDSEVKAYSGTVLRWDVYQTCPMVGNEWIADEDREEGTKVEFKRLYLTFVGNAPSSGKILRIADKFHPKGEIPLQPIRSIPTDSNEFYHPTHGEIERPVYTALCAIRNATIDNLGVRARPAMFFSMRDRGLMKDFTWKAGVKGFLEDMNNMPKTFEPPEMTMQSHDLIEQLKEETKLAMATDPARLGEYAGARTSKYEVQRVTGSTDTTIALQNVYVVGQLIPWMARQMLLYTQKFVDPKVIRRVVNAHLPQPIAGDMVGEYDIEVDIVGEYMEEQEKTSQAAEAMQILSSPTMAKIVPPATTLALLKQFFEARKFNVARLDFEGASKDSEANAMARVTQMLNTGVFIPPEQGESISVHLRVARAQRVRWQGLEESGDPRAANVELLDRYIQALTQMEQNENQQMAMMQQGMQQQPQEQGMGQPPMGQQGGMM